jgi:hypothetical protein
MYGGDCRRFLAAIPDREQVTVVSRDERSAAVEPFEEPCTTLDTLVLWNRRWLRSVERRAIPESPRGRYYRIPYDTPTLEFSPTSAIEKWDDRPAMRAGRIYAASYQSHAAVAQWYERIARWLRRNFHGHRIASGVSYVGPDAWKWHERGGLLLPMVRPAVTAEWRKSLHTPVSRRSQATPHDA